MPSFPREQPCRGGWWSQEALNFEQTSAPYPLLQGRLLRGALWRGFAACPAMGSQRTADQGWPGPPSVPCPVTGSSCVPEGRPALSPHPQASGRWCQALLGPPPYPEAAASRCGHPSRHLPSASSPAPASASPRRWPRPPWPAAGTHQSGAFSRWRALPSPLRPPGHPSGPGTVRAIRWLPTAAVQAWWGCLVGFGCWGYPGANRRQGQVTLVQPQPF